MPRKKRKPKEMKGYSRGHLLHLFFGHDFFGGGFGREHNPAIMAEMLSAWPVLREQVFQLARERSIRRKFTQLPAAWWLYDAPEPRNRDETESAQLSRLGLSAEILLFG